MWFFKNIVAPVHLATCALNKSSKSLQKKVIPIVSVWHQTKVVMDFQLHVPVVSARAILMGSDRYQEVCCVIVSLTYIMQMKTKMGMG